MRSKVNIKPSFTHKDLADSAKKHQQHVSESKKKTNPFDCGPAMIITTGIEACSRIFFGLYKAPE